jgi:heme exporter protein A
MTAIVAEDVAFSYGPQRVLAGVTMEVERGEVLALVGPNGAGKTTFLKILAGLLRPDSGRVRLEGIELERDPVGFRRLIGVISHQPYVYPRLSGRENLEFYARLYGLAQPKVEAARVLQEMGLSAAKEREAATYSRGMLQRLAIGRALLHSPRVLLLDEPFTGLDPQAREKLEVLLGALSDGDRAVLMTTHDVDACRGFVDRVATLAGGRIVP